MRPLRRAVAHSSRFVQAAVLTIASLMAASSVAHAAPVVDDQRGLATDDLRDTLGVVTTSLGTYNQAHSPVARTWGAANPALAFQLITATYTPASLKRWSKVFLNASVGDASKITVAALDPSIACANAACDNAVIATLTLVPAGVAGWDFAADLGAVAATHDDLRLRIRVDGVGAIIPPVLEKIGLSWEPRSLLAVDLLTRATTCTNTEVGFQVPYSVSRVGAEGLVVLTNPTLVAALPGAPAGLYFASATAGGRAHYGTDLVLGGVTIHHGDVYWTFDHAAAGTTQILEARFLVPQGATDTARYSATARVGANNADVATSTPKLTTLSATPAPALALGYDGSYHLFGRDWAPAGAAISAWVEVRNHHRDTCGQDYNKAVIVHRLDGFDLPPNALAAGPTNISDGGTFVPANTTSTFYPGPGQVVVAGPAIVWTAESLGLGSVRRFTWDLVLADDQPNGPLAGGEIITTTAQLRSPFESERVDVAHELGINIPAYPSGLFALGQAINGGREISATRDDLATNIVNYGKTVGFPMVASNTGASELQGVWQFQRIADDVAFTSMSAAGVELFYTTSPGAAGPTPNDVIYTPGSLTLGNTWRSYDLDPPVDPSAVTWVAARIPRLASGYFPIPGVPESVIVDVWTETRPPAATCQELTAVANAHFIYEGFVPFGFTELVPNGNPSFTTDSEPVAIKDLLPGFVGSSLTGPSARYGAGSFDYVVTVVNDSGASATDRAAPATLTATYPIVTINGVARPLPLVAINADGEATVAPPGPTSAVVTWPLLPAGATRTVRLTFNWPRGALPDDVATLRVKLAGQDDFCGTVTRDLTHGVTYRATPALRLAKSVDLAVVGVGGTLNYTLRALNSSDTASPGTVVFDRIADGLSFGVGAPVSGGGAFYFSNAASLPDRLGNSLDAQTELLDGGLFVRGTEALDGTWTSPISNPRWIAIKIDDTTLSPPLLGAGIERTIRFSATVVSGTEGSLVANRGAVDAPAPILGAVSETTRTIISGTPHVTPNHLCPEVVASAEQFTYDVSFYNSASTPNTAVIISELIPPGLTFVDASFAWNAASSALAGFSVPYEIDPPIGQPAPAGRTITWDVTEAINGPLGSLQGGTFTIEVTADADLASNTFVTPTGSAYAANALIPGGVSFDSACNIRVSNADLWLRAFVDRTNPIGNDPVLVSLVLSNADFHFADQVGLTVTLPAGLTYLAGSTTLGGFGYSYTPSVQPVVTGQTLRWAHGVRTLSGPAVTAGRLEGDSGQVILRFVATVAAATPANTTLVINAVTTTSTGQGDNALPDAASVTLVTPLPDPTVDAAVKAASLPGESVTWTLDQANLSRQLAPTQGVVARLPATPSGAAAASFVRATGATAYFHAAPLNGVTPPFSAADPANTGWTTTATAATTYVAFDVGPLAGLSDPPDLAIELRLAAPDGTLAPAGASFEICATIAQAGGSPVGDSNPNNNSDCATTQIPGLNISAAIACDPSGPRPGVLPGGVVNATMFLSNTGTTPTFGVSLASTLGPSLTLLSVDRASVSAETMTGQATAFISASGAVIPGTVPLTRLPDGRWVVGSNNATAPDYYRRLGLSASSRVRLGALLSVAASARDGLVLTAGVNVATDYQVGWTAGVDAPETYLADNAATCGTTVRRADLAVTIEAESTGPATTGDRVTWRVGYDNLGSTTAQDVALTTMMDQGATLVPSSFRDLPPGFALDFLGPAGWGYTSAVATGAGDPAIRGYRIHDGDLSSPVSGGFSVSGAALSTGTLTHAAISDGRFGASGPADVSYTTPVISAPHEVLAWGLLELGDYTIQGTDGVLATVYDATTGSPTAIPGFIDLPVDPSGALDLAALPTTYQKLQVRLTLTGLSPVCTYDSTDVIRLATGHTAPYESLVPLHYEAVAPGGDVLARYPALDYISQLAFLVLRPDGTFDQQFTSGIDVGDATFIHIDDAVAAFTARSKTYVYRKHEGRWSLTATYTPASGNETSLVSDNAAVRASVEPTQGRLVIPVRVAPTNAWAALVEDASAPNGLRLVALTDISNGSGSVLATADGALAGYRGTSGSHTLNLWTLAANGQSFVSTAMPFGHGNVVSIVAGTEHSFGVRFASSISYALRFGSGAPTLTELEPAPGGSSLVQYGLAGGRFAGVANGSSEGGPTAWTPGATQYRRFYLSQQGHNIGFSLGPKQNPGSPSGVIRTVDYQLNPPKWGARIYVPDPGSHTYTAINMPGTSSNYVTAVYAVTPSGIVVGRDYINGIDRFVAWIPDAGAVGGYRIALLDDGIDWTNLVYQLTGEATVAIVDPAALDEPRTTTAWNLAATSGDPNLIASSSAYVRDYGGSVNWTGGAYAVGSSSAPSPAPSLNAVPGTVATVWGPELTDGDLDGWGYKALGFPSGFGNWSNGYANYVAPDGAILGQGDNAALGDRRALSWVPSGPGTWSPHRILFNGAAVRIDDTPATSGRAGYDSGADSTYYQYRSGPQIFATLEDTNVNGLIYRDASAAAGFRALFPVSPFANAPPPTMTAIAPALGMIGGAARDPFGVKQPAVWTLDGDAPVTTLLPGAPEGGVVVDIAADRVAGWIASGSAYLPVVWVKTGASWQIHVLGGDFQRNTIAFVSGKHVLAVGIDNSLLAWTWTGTGYVANPLTPADGQARAWERDFDYTGPFQYPGYAEGKFIVRDGAAVAVVTWDGGDNASADIDFVTHSATLIGGPTYGAYWGGGRILGYAVDGNWVVLEPAGSGYAVRVLGPASNFGGYDPQTYVNTYPLLAALAVPNASHTVYVDHGTTGELITPAIPPYSYQAPFHPVAGGKVNRFASRSPVIWGCDERPSANFDRVSVAYRTAQSPSYSYDTIVEDLCQTAIDATVAGTTTTPEVTLVNNQDSASAPVATFDLQLGITTTKRLVAAGSDYDVTVTVTNAGPSTADLVALTFTAPAALGGQVSTLALGTLEGGQTTTRTFPFTVGALPDGTNLVANASVAAQGIECNVADNADKTTTTVLNQPNGWVTIDAPATARLRQSFPITVHYGNDSDVALNDSDIAAILPPELTIVSGTLTRDAQVLAAGASSSYTIVVQADACDLAGNELVSLATFADPDDVIASDNDDVATTTLLAPAAQLDVSLTPDRTTTATGTRVGWTLDIRNDGSADAADILVTVPLPAGLTYVAGSLTNGSVAGNTITVSLTNLFAGDHTAIRFATDVSADNGQTLTATATAISPDSCPVDAVASLAVSNPSLIITASADRATTCGAPIAWAVTVFNPYPIALPVTVTSPIPAGTSYIDDSAAGGDSIDIGAGTITFTIAALAPNNGLTLSYSTTAPASGSASITAQAQTLGPLASSNLVTVDVVCAGLTLAKTAALDCKGPGDVTTVNVTASNSGLVALTNVVVVDRVPAAVTPSLPVANATWDPGARTLTFAPTTLTANASATYSYAVMLGAAGSLTLDVASATANGGYTAISQDPSGAILDCNSNNECIVDSCEPATGCVHDIQVGDSCGDDDDVCTAGTCDAAGACIETLLTTDVGDDCNGIDDDCDALTDEDFVPTSATCGDGLCAVTGRNICVAGAIKFELGTAILDACTPNTGSAETCNNLDDDCDGTVDNGLSVYAEACVVTGGCPGTRGMECVNGAATATGPCTTNATAVDTCNGIDDDCDAQTDEDFVATTVTCTDGDTCPSSGGLTTCDDGTLGDTCDFWTGLPDTQCTGQIEFGYAIVTDAAGAPIGSVRCQQDLGAIGTPVVCDTHPGTNELVIYPDLFCEGGTP